MIDFLDAVLNGTAVMINGAGIYRVVSTWDDGTCDVESVETGEILEDIPMESIKCYQKVAV